MSEETNDPSRRTETPSPASGPEPTTTGAADEVATGVAATESRLESAASPAAPPGKSGSGMGLMIGVLVVLAALGGGAYLTRDQWLPLVAPLVDQTAGKMAPSGDATASAEPVIKAATVEDAMAAQQQLAQQLDTLSGRVMAMEENVGQLKQAIDKLASESNTKELAAAVAVVADRVTRLERTSADISQLQREFGELNSKAVALREGFSGLNAAILATNQLARAVDDGVAYARPLAAVKAVAGDDADVAAILALLEPHAESGIATFAALRAQFPSVADAVARAAPTTGGDEWYQRALDKVISLVTIRATGEAAVRAGGIDAILAEAQTALDGGDLASAVAQVGQLEGTAAAAAADWLTSARLRLQAIEAVSRLQEQAAIRLAQARG